MIPISVYTKLKAFPLGNFGCREQWDSYESAVAYMVFLDLMLLVIPVLLMSLSYGMIVRTLWMGMRVDKDIEDGKYFKCTIAFSFVNIGTLKKSRVLDIYIYVFV